MIPDRKIIGQSGSVLVVAAFAMATALGAVPPELWVVGEGSKSVKIVTTATPETVLPATINLSAGFPPPAPAVPPDPHGIAFSTLPGGAELVFVTQGRYVRVIDVATRAIQRTVDLGTTLPGGRMLQRLRRIEPARPAQIPQAGGGFAWKTYLYAAATAIAPGGSNEPWYFVLDQDALACATPPCPSPIVARGPLPVPPGTAAEAVDLALRNTRSGNRLQRAWFTVRDTSGATARTIEIARGPNAGSGWSVVPGSEHVASFSAANPAPPLVPVMTTYDRELPVWGASCPAGAAAAGESCVEGLDVVAGCFLMPGLVTGGAMSYRGPGDGDVWSTTVELATPLAAGAGTLHRIRTRTGIAASYPVGDNPSDVVVLDPTRTGKVFVTNRGSDSVSVLRPGGVVVHLPLTAKLGSDAPAACSICPIAAAVKVTACSVLDATTTILDADSDGANDDVKLSWTPSAGCAAGQTFSTYCKCSADIPADCPPECSATLALSTDATAGVDGNPCGSLEPDENPDIAGDWTELGNPTSNPSVVHLNVANLVGFIEYSVVPNGI